MNRKQFLAALAKTPREWRLSRYGSRIRLGNCCPITALASPPLAAVEVYAVADNLGISTAFRGAIMAAADYSFISSKYKAALRAELLKACGLAEGPG